MLNLGMPFLPVDDAADQAEEAVATGLPTGSTKVVQRDPGGLNKLAKAYNEKRATEATDRRGAPRPPLPWLEVAARRQEHSSDVTSRGDAERATRFSSTRSRSGMRAATSAGRDAREDPHGRRRAAAAAGGARVRRCADHRR